MSTNRRYFYLSKNIRLGLTHWKKIRIYLGGKKPAKKAIEKAVKAIEARARLILPKTKYPYLSEHDAETLQDLKKSYKEWQKHTPKNSECRRLI